MPFPPINKTMEGLLRDHETRVTLVERRLAIGGSGGSSTPYDAQPGMVMPFSGTTVPEGWLKCDGSLVSRTTYAKLFAVIGTTYGPGDGSTTFRLPDYKGRVLVGQDTGQTEFDILGETGGEKAHTLTIAELPVHDHTVRFEADPAVTSNNVFISNAAAHTDRISKNGPYGGAGGAAGAGLSGNAGGGAAHNNLQPYAVAQYIISTGEGVGGGPATTTSGGSGGVTPAGIISPFAGPTPPVGWLACDGAAVSRAGFPALFTAIGTTWGAGDGSTTFNLPNLKGRIPVGQDVTQTEFDVLGETGGTKAVTLTANQSGVQEHRHQLPLGAGAAAGVDDNAFRAASGGDANFRTSGVAHSSSGASGSKGYGSTLGALPAIDAHTNLQPYAVANYVISTGAGSTPSVPAVLPVTLWQEFSLTGSGLVANVGGSPAWTVVKGNLGATLSADKTTITLPSAGTYRILPHLGVSGSAGAAANANAAINGTNYTPSFGYGVCGPAGVWSYDTEFYITVTGPTTVRHYASANLYDWSWLRIEKVEPFYPTSPALAVQQGPSALRDAIFGVPTNATEQASLANRVVTWFNTDKGWHEVYYTVAGTAGLTAKGLASGFPAGWYPAAGSLIWGTTQRLSEQNVAAGDVRVNTTAVDLVGGVTFASSALIVPIGGIYEVSGNVYIWAVSGTYRSAGVINAATNEILATGTSSGAWTIATVPRRSRLTAGTQVALRTSGDAAQTIRAQAATDRALELMYVGPPLANG